MATFSRTEYFKLNPELRDKGLIFAVADNKTEVGCMTAGFFNLQEASAYCDRMNKSCKNHWNFRLM